MPRFVIVLPLSPLRTGDSFSVARWPLHVTVLPPFMTAATPEEVARAMTEVALEQQGITAVASTDAMFGRRHDVPVTLVVENERLNALHAALVAAVRPHAADPEEPAFTGPGFRPHITVKNDRRVYEGDQLSLTQIALVDMAARAAPSGRMVLAIAGLRSTS